MLVQPKLIPSRFKIKSQLTDTTHKWMTDFNNDHLFLTQDKTRVSLTVLTPHTCDTQTALLRFK